MFTCYKLYLCFCHYNKFLVSVTISTFHDGAEYGSRVASSKKTVQFFVCVLFLLFYMLDVISITVYDRHRLLKIGSSVAQRKPDFEFLNAGALFTDTASESFVWTARPR